MPYAKSPIKKLKDYVEHNGYMLFWALAAVLVAAALLLVAQFVNTVKEFQFIGQGIQHQNTITVSGSGEVSAVPDVAEFSFAVVNEAEVVADAQRAVTSTMNDLIAYLESFGVEEKNIKTLNYNIVPRYEYPKRREGGNRTLAGYEVSHWVQVKLERIDEAGDALAGIASRGATNVSGLRLTIEDEEEVATEARREAIADANTKAMVLARDLGVTIVAVVNFHESGGAVSFRAFALAEAGGAPDALPVPKLPTGENIITSSVTVTYAIE